MEVSFREGVVMLINLWFQTRFDDVKGVFPKSILMH